MKTVMGAQEISVIYSIVSIYNILLYTCILISGRKLDKKKKKKIRLIDMPMSWFFLYLLSFDYIPYLC
jgi:hypothetical protein